MKKNKKTLLNIYKQDTKDGPVVIIDYSREATSDNFDAIVDLLRQTFEDDDALVAAFLVATLHYFKNKSFKEEDCINIFSTMTKEFYELNNDDVDNKQEEEQKILFPLAISKNNKYKN